METSDKRILSQMVASLGELTLDKPSALEQWKEPFHRLLRSEVFLFYNIQTTLQGVELKTIGGVSEIPNAQRLASQFREFPTRFRDHFPAYNPIHIEPALQNTVFTPGQQAAHNPWARQVSFYAQIWPQFGLGGFDMIRALICDGPALLYSIGGMRREPYSAREVGILRHLIPHLQKRLRLERAIDGAPSLSLLVGVLEGFGRPAFLLGPRGNIEACNQLGVRLWNLERQSLNQSLAESLRNRASPGAPFEVTPIAGHESASYVLAVQRCSLASTARHAQAAARRWSLTPRQSQVLALLVDGQTNWQIAANLRCAERTVEIHVSAILRRAQVDNRATLIASVLTLEP